MVSDFPDVLTDAADLKKADGEARKYGYSK